MGYCDRCITCHLNKGLHNLMTGANPCGLTACANPPPKTIMSDRIIDFGQELPQFVLPPQFERDTHYPILRYHKVHPDAIPPFYSRANDACLDLSITEDVEVKPLCYETVVIQSSDSDGGVIEDVRVRTHDSRVTVGTGLAFQIPKGYRMAVYIRSGHAFKQGLALTGAVGIIEDTYRGEVKLNLVNFGTETIYLKKGERVAQCEIEVVKRCVVQEEIELEPNFERGENGFGSSGK